MALSKAIGLAFKVDESYKNRLKKGLGMSLAERTGVKEELLPVPAVYVINKQMKVVYAYYNSDYKTRLSPEELLEKIEANP
jgi:peroxiredoxin